MARIVIASHAASDTINALTVFMNASNTGNHSVLRMKRTNSRFRGREGDVLVNYGSRNTDLMRHVGAATLLNSPEAVGNASDKRRTFELLSAAGVSAVESTTDLGVARGWLSSGDYVFVRNTVSGHSGAGIDVYGLSQPESSEPEAITVSNGNLPNAPLYTKGVFMAQQHREFRIHIFKGKVSFVQQKKRREGWREIEGYSNIIRNFHTGWVYANQSAAEDVNRAAIYHASKAVEALGLDYGAVDVITRGDQAFILEVNTAPGMTGTNLETFGRNLIKVANSQEITSIVAIPSTDPLSEQTQPQEQTPRRSARTTVPVVVQGEDNRFVKGVYNNIMHVGYYNQDSDTYTLAGIEIAVEASEFSVREVV